MNIIYEQIKKDKKIIIISIICGIIITFSAAVKAYANRVSSEISDAVIRFHVLANSDEEFDQNLSQILLDGGYVIKKGEFMGEITDEDIKSIKWFEGKAKGELINDNELSARVKKARISIADENGVAVVSIKAECSVENGISESIKYSQERLETVIKSNLENTINKARKLNADFIGLTDGDGMGSKSFKIDVEVKIISTGVIK